MPVKMFSCFFVCNKCMDFIHKCKFQLDFLHRSLQYFTDSQSSSHFFRHTNGLPQVKHTLLGKCCFFTPFIRCLPLPFSCCFAIWALQMFWELSALWELWAFWAILVSRADCVSSKPLPFPPWQTPISASHKSAQPSQSSCPATPQPAADNPRPTSHRTNKC